MTSTIPSVSALPTSSNLSISNSSGQIDMSGQQQQGSFTPAPTAISAAPMLPQQISLPQQPFAIQPKMEKIEPGIGNLSF